MTLHRTTPTANETCVVRQTEKWYQVSGTYNDTAGAEFDTPVGGRGRHKVRLGQAYEHLMST